MRQSGIVGSDTEGGSELSANTFLAVAVTLALSLALGVQAFAGDWEERLERHYDEMSKYYEHLREAEEELREGDFDDYVEELERADEALDEAGSHDGERLRRRGGLSIRYLPGYGYFELTYPYVYRYPYTYDRYYRQRRFFSPYPYYYRGYYNPYGYYSRRRGRGSFGDGFRHRGVRRFRRRGLGGFRRDTDPAGEGSQASRGHQDCIDRLPLPEVRTTRRSCVKFSGLDPAKRWRGKSGTRFDGRFRPPRPRPRARNINAPHFPQPPFCIAPAIIDLARVWFVAPFAL